MYSEDFNLHMEVLDIYFSFSKQRKCYSIDIYTTLSYAQGRQTEKCHFFLLSMNMLVSVLCLISMLVTIFFFFSNYFSVTFFFLKKKHFFLLDHTHDKFKRFNMVTILIFQMILYFL